MVQFQNLQIHDTHAEPRRRFVCLPRSDYIYFASTLSFRIREYLLIYLLHGVIPHLYCPVRDFDQFRKTALRFWERRRIVYNLVFIPPALLGYLAFAVMPTAVGDRPHLDHGVIVLLFLISAASANVCFSLCYMLEFLFGSDAPDSAWLRLWRSRVMVLGTIFAVLLAVVGGRNIAVLEFSFRF